MNQQEIDRLFERYGQHVYIQSQGLIRSVMLRDDFTAAINEATAQARREVLEEAEKCCYDLHFSPDDTSFKSGYNDGATACRLAIRALAAQPREGM